MTRRADSFLAHPVGAEILSPPAITRQALAPIGAVFWYAGRPLRVVSVADGLAILEELTAWGDSLAGQLCLWDADAALRALSWRLPPAL